MTLTSYLPEDRLRALAVGETLPDLTTGSALFADISGFTALTESLRETLGLRLGTEELSRQLDAVFSALIAQVEKYGGSVIGFARDAMMCWFDSHGGGLATGVRAAACAFGMQSAVRAFPALGLKVAITSGQARRKSPKISSSSSISRRNMGSVMTSLTRIQPTSMVPEKQ